jgi:hypothetical protein
MRWTVLWTFWSHLIGGSADISFLVHLSQQNVPRKFFNIIIYMLVTVDINYNPHLMSQRWGKLEANNLYKLIIFRRGRVFIRPKLFEQYFPSRLFRSDLSHCHLFRYYDLQEKGALKNKLFLLHTRKLSKWLVNIWVFSSRMTTP